MMKRGIESSPERVVDGASSRDAHGDLPDYVLQLLEVLPVPASAVDESVSSRKSALEPLGAELLQRAQDGHERQQVLGYQAGALPEILEITQSRNSASEQITQDIRAVQQRSLSAASDRLEKVDKLHTETLLHLVDDGKELLSKIQSRFQALLKKHREEFGKSYDCNLLLEYGIEARYQTLKSAIDSVMKRSFDRSNSRFDEIDSLNKQNYEWTMEELRATKSRWETGDVKRKQSHDAVNEKLAKLTEHTLDAAGKVCTFHFVFVCTKMGLKCNSSCFVTDVQICIAPANYQSAVQSAGV
jgi:ElaB/YqjD/DUF883 family membrane-anchored ribosome-binding protein